MILKVLDFRRLLLLSAVNCALWTGTQVLAQENSESPDEEQPFRVDVNLITLQFTVTDQAGRFENSLSADDFIVEEYGRPVAIDVFEQPRNQSGEAPELWLAFLIDVSGSTFATRTEEIVAAQTFLDNLSEATKIGVFGFTDELLTFQTFTGDRDLTLQAIRQARKHLGKTAIYDSLTGLIGLMSTGAPAGSRKAIILISDGLDPAHDRAPESAALASEKGFVIYSIRVPSSAQVYIGPNPGREDPAKRARRQHKNDEQIESFGQLAAATGGKSFSGFETILDFDQTLAEINDHLFGNLYHVGYYSNLPRTENFLDRIQVRTRQAGVRVASAFKKLPQQFDAKRSLLRVFFDTSGESRLPGYSTRRFREIGADMDVLGQTPEGTLVGLPFRLKVSPLSFRGAMSEGVQTQLGVLGLLLDHNGKEIVRLREIIRVTLDARDVREGRGIIYSNRLVAPPGAYILKIALLELSTWRLTSFSRPVTIQGS